MRYEDWQPRFWHGLEKMSEVRFEYGSHDCILFGAKMADVISSDGGYVERARKAYDWSNDKDALRLLQNQALGVLIESVLGTMTRWQELQWGDLVLVVHDNGRGPEQMLGVHDGTQIICPREFGLQAIWWSEALGGWRIE